MAISLKSTYSFTTKDFSFHDKSAIFQAVCSSFKFWYW